MAMTKLQSSNLVLITAAEAAKIAGVSLRTIWNWEAARAISVIRVGRVVRLEREQFLDELRAFSTTANS